MPIRPPKGTPFTVRKSSIPDWMLKVCSPTFKSRSDIYRDLLHGGHQTRWALMEASEIGKSCPGQPVHAPRDTSPPRKGGHHGLLRVSPPGTMSRKMGPRYARDGLRVVWASRKRGRLQLLFRSKEVHPHDGAEEDRYTHMCPGRCIHGMRLSMWRFRFI
jgi:hypothetical protein